MHIAQFNEKAAIVGMHLLSNVGNPDIEIQIARIAPARRDDAIMKERENLADVASPSDHASALCQISQRKAVGRRRFTRQRSRPLQFHGFRMTGTQHPASIATLAHRHIWRKTFRVADWRSRPCMLSLAGCGDNSSVAPPGIPDSASHPAAILTVRSSCSEARAALHALRDPCRPQPRSYDLDLHPHF